MCVLLLAGANNYSSLQALQFIRYTVNIRIYHNQTICCIYLSLDSPDFYRTLIKKMLPLYFILQYGKVSDSDFKLERTLFIGAIFTPTGATHTRLG